jgi:hypothetical protein
MDSADSAETRCLLEASRWATLLDNNGVGRSGVTRQQLRALGAWLLDEENYRALWWTLIARYELRDILTRSPGEEAKMN